MQSRWRIFVLSLAIFSLLAPAPAFCCSVQPADHGCCAPQTQLSAPSCCQPDAASQSAAHTQSSNPSNSEPAPSPQPTSLIAVPQPAMLPPHANAPPILLPATILRT
jgi:hypothetical protein